MGEKVKKGDRRETASPSHTTSHNPRCLQRASKSQRRACSWLTRKTVFFIIQLVLNHTCELQDEGASGSVAYDINTIEENL